MSHTSLRWHLTVIFTLTLLVPMGASAQVRTANPYGTPDTAATGDAGVGTPSNPPDAEHPARQTAHAANPPATPAAATPAAVAIPASATPDAGATPDATPAAGEPAALTTPAPAQTSETSPLPPPARDEFAEADADATGVGAPVEEEPIVEPPARSNLPAGEAERMADRPVDAARIRFRPGHGLEIESADGAFSLTTRVRVQVLYQLENSNTAGVDPTQQLTLRRARIQFGGHFFGHDNSYKIQLGLSPRDMGIKDNDFGRAPHHTPLLDYYLDFHQLRDLHIRVGQFKVPFNRERMNSSGNLQMVGRSNVNAQFNLDRDLGIDFNSSDLFGLGHVRYHLGAYIARGREAVGAGNFHMMGLARVEYLPFGSFDDNSQVDFARTSDPRLAIGAAFAYVDHARTTGGITGTRPADGGTTQTRHLALDAIFKLSGFSAMAEVLYRSGHRNPGTAVDEFGVAIPIEAPATGYGITLQVGYLLPRAPFEIAARYATIQRIGTATASSLTDESELGLGLNYYFAQHPFKLQADVINSWSQSFGNDGALLFELQLQGSL